MYLNGIYVEKDIDEAMKVFRAIGYEIEFDHLFRIILKEYKDIDAKFFLEYCIHGSDDILEELANDYNHEISKILLHQKKEQEENKIVRTVKINIRKR